METKKKNITDTFGLISIWLYRGLGVFGTSFLAYIFFQLLNSSSLINTEFIFLSVLLVFYIIVTVKVFIDYSSISELSISEYGIHSNKTDVSWTSISKIYVKTKFGVPILFIEFLEDEEEYILKTVLGHLENKAEKTLNKIKGKWSIHTNT